MGSQAIQGQLWGQRPKDWSTIQEPTGLVGYKYVLDYLQPNTTHKILDVGCGSGLFIDLASSRSDKVTGIDASKHLIKEAKKRSGKAEFLTGEMENLPFADNTFDIVCGFNSFQYAANTRKALAEAKRVLRDKGKLATMIWGNKEECEAASYLNAVGQLMPSPTLGAAGPFSLSENKLLEKILLEIGLKIVKNTDVDAIWDYPNTDTALKGLLSVGPVAKVIGLNGFDKVNDTVLNAVQPYIQSNGHVVYKNKYRIIISEK